MDHGKFKEIFNEEIKRTHHGSRQTLMFLLSRVLISFTLVFLHEYPIIQCIVCFYVMFAKLCYTYHENPFKMRKQRYVEIFNDQGSVIMTQLQMVYLKGNYSFDDKYKIALLIVINIGSVIFVHLLLMIKENIKEYFKIIKQKYRIKMHYIRKSLKKP